MAGPDLVAFAAALSDAVEERLGGYVADVETLYADVVPRAGGTLAEALRVDLSARGAGSYLLHGEVDDTVAPHGKWIDQPVDEIVPVRAKILHWFGSGGGDVFARRVVPSRAHEGWWQGFVDRVSGEVIQR